MGLPMKSIEQKNLVWDLYISDKSRFEEIESRKSYPVDKHVFIRNVNFENSNVRKS